jgi:response regulator RpfG family c-di-GMP phosphodiesterase
MEQDPIYRVLFKYTKALSAALGHRDTLTRLHSERVRGLATEIGIGCGLAASELGILNIGASFHDIGKIGIPDHILLKPEKLNDAEWAVMRQHSAIGEEILLATEIEGSQQASLVIRHHHEHYDGSGYPDALAGEQISILARIVSVADSYDAMAVTRAYHRAKKHDEIMAMMHEESGLKHDPELLRIFCTIIEVSEFRARDRSDSAVLLPGTRGQE